MTFRGRSPATPIAVLALAVACTGITPAEAVRAVKRAAFATNAGKVDGIDASRSPKPGNLVPLGADGRFSPSVLPSGLRGPRGTAGPAGAPGATGSRGPSDGFISSPAAVNLSRTANVQTEVAALRNLPAGSYLVVFTGEGTMRTDGGLYINREVTANGTKVSATRGIVGDAYGGSEVMADVTSVSRATPFDISVRCSSDQTTTAPVGPPGVHLQKLAAIRVETLSAATG